LSVPVATRPANLASAGIVAAIALPVAAIASSAQFSSSTSLSRATTRLFGLGASAVRFRSSTSALVGVGEGEELEVVVALGHLVEAVEDVGEAWCAESSRRRVNDGKQRIVTALIAPSAPIRSAPRTSAPGPPPRSVAHAAVASTISTASTRAEMLPNPPGPLVPVEIAPAIVCARLSPCSSSASPSPASSSFQVAQDGPGADPDEAARAVDVEHPRSASRRTSSPRFIAASVEGVSRPRDLDLLPRGRSHSRFASASSSRDRGATIRVGRQRWSPASGPLALLGHPCHGHKYP